MTWSKNCVLTDMTTRVTQGDNPAMVALIGTTFKITDTKLDVSVNTLSIENGNDLLEQLKKGFKTTNK